MEPSAPNKPSTRLLALGNEFLSDDAFGLVVAREVRRRLGNHADIVATAAAGFDLIDYLLGVSRLIVVDTIETGVAPPGTIHVFGEADLRPAAGPSPHLTGIFETLRIARAVALEPAAEVVFIAVEAADCSTLGGPMSPAVEAAIRPVSDRVIDFLDPEPAKVRYA